MQNARLLFKAAQALPIWLEGFCVRLMGGSFRVHGFSFRFWTFGFRALWCTVWGMASGPNQHTC